MTSERHNFSVSVPFTHRVCFTRGAFSTGREVVISLLQEGGGRRALVYVEDAVADAWPTLLVEIMDTLEEAGVEIAGVDVRAGGEAAKKDDALVRDVWSAVEKARIDRHSYLLCIGGGAFLDAVGFAAATAHRGVRLLRFPTTTLSQDDSGVGVKNGINAFGKKNWIGAFAVPYAVVNDFLLLSSQDAETRRIGLIEAVKVALVKDATFFDWIEEHAAALAECRDDVMEECVKRSALLHAQHITNGGDPFEMGSSRPLDFGHWAAHKLEQISGFTLSHGEAVAVGLWLDVLYSVKAGLLDQRSAQRIRTVMETMGFPLFDERLLTRDSHGEFVLLAGLEEFREHLGGKLTILLLRAPGVGVDVHEMNAAWVAECIEEMHTAALANSEAVAIIEV